MNLEKQIEESRITYPDTDNGGKTIRGSPFCINFNEEIDLDEFADTVFTADEPWGVWAVYHKVEEDYWSVPTVAYHIDENGDITDASKFDMEVCPDFIRVYVKDQAKASRIASFVEQICEHYDAEVEFVN